MIKKLFFSIFFSLGFFTSFALLPVKRQDSLLSKLKDSILSNHYPKIHSLLIARGKNLLMESYFNGYTRDSLHDTRSSFKSVTSLLVGIAIDKGFIKNVDQKIYEFFPEYPWLKEDPLKKLLTIRNLLEMKSGLDCEEFNETKDCEDEMSQTDNWVKYGLEIKMIHKPGEIWSYTSVDPMILSGVLRRATHMTVMKFAEKYLFKPLNITHYKWSTDSSGNGMTAGSFYIRPVDMIKLGQLVKGDGVWNGKMVISKRWIQQSTDCKIEIPDFSYMQTSRTKFAYPQQAYYGFYWYREMIKTDLFKEDVLFASGNGGQYIFVIKRLNLTVVFTQGNYKTFKAKQAFEILAKYIIPHFISKA
ncbi:serine hydrolase [Pedobacter sp. MR2016-19]|uniref:serine hydrolase domain-containing protein n=1 Tax=Pedobacter sp. MR2016-19 TaxID=2780089 RepID=UPI001D0A1CE2|nr:serine hydrolase [Pedobacter sp. MR2016-19]